MKLKVKEVYALLAAANKESDDKLKEAADKGQNGFEGYGALSVKRSILDSLLTNCELEIEIPKDKEQFIA
jgi:hypothetical protein